MFVDRLLQEVESLVKGSDYQSAVKELKRVSNIYEKWKNWDKIVATNLNIAAYLSKDNQKEKALEHYQLLKQQVLENEGNASLNLALVYHKLGVWHYKEFKHKEALALFKQSLAIRLKQLSENHKDIANSHFNIAMAHVQRGELKEALGALEQSLIIRQKNQEKTYIAKCHRELGFIYTDLGDYAQAKPHFKVALAIFMELYGEIDYDVALTYQDMGSLEKELGNTSAAIKNLEAALRINTALGNDFIGEVANCYNDLGVIYDENNLLNKALDKYSQALNLYTKMKGTDAILIAKVKNNIGDVHKKLGNGEVALNFLQEALEGKQAWYKGKSHPVIATTHDNIGNLFFQQGKLEEALAQYNLAISNLLPEFIAKEPFDLPTIKQIATIPQKTHLLTILHDKAKAVVSFYNKTKENELLIKALDTYHLIDSLVDEMRQEMGVEGSKLFWIAKTRSIYEEAVNVALEAKDEATAFQFIEKSKAVLLLEGLQEAEAKGVAGIPDSLLQRDHFLNTHIYSLGKQVLETQNSDIRVRLNDSLSRFRNERQQLIRNLELDFPKYYQLKYDNAIIPLKEFQQVYLQEGDVLLEYLVGDNFIYVFVIQKEKINVHQLPHPSDLDKWINDFRLAVVNSKFISNSLQESSAIFDQLGRKLFAALLKKPLEGIPSSSQRLIIVPDGILSFLPFDILPTEPIKGEVDFMHYPYLIKNYPISYSYSSSLLAENIQRRAFLSPKFPLMVVAPEYGKADSLSPLSGAKFEAKTIAAMYRRSHLLMENRATKNNFLKNANQYSILHLAMHGTAFTDKKQEAKLYFHKERNIDEDAILHPYELHQLHLNANLVVLSACETGLGEYAKGEGVLSMARGFMYGGSSSVVMSLWKTNDKATRQLMEAFHTQILGGVTKDKALQQAKLSYLENPLDGLGHPYYWAGFVNIGDYQAVPKNQWTWWFWVMIFGGLGAILVLWKRFLSTRPIN